MAESGNIQSDIESIVGGPLGVTEGVSAAPSDDGGVDDMLVFLGGGHRPVVTGGVEDLFRGDIEAFEETGTVSELLNEIYAFPDDELSSLQLQMFAAGLFSTGTDLDDIEFGSADEQTFTAWRNLLRRAARTKSSGRNVTPFGLLEETLGRAGGLEAALEGRADAAGSTVVSDPVGLARQVNAVAEQVVGRRLDVDAQRAFVAIVHRMQRQGQTVQGAPGGQATAVDVGAQADQFVREQDPEGAAGMDSAGAYRGFLDALGFLSGGGGGG